MINHWHIKPFKETDKKIHIDGPLPLIVDNDDVDTVEVEFMITAVVKALNASWSRLPEEVKLWREAKKNFYENFEGDWDQFRFQVGIHSCLNLAQAVERLANFEGGEIIDTATGDVVLKRD